MKDQKKSQIENNENDDWKKMILLIFLYTIQGVPLGLSFGSIPFLLQKNISKTEIGIFSLTNYPYALKLLWSPFVDSYYSSSFGRRKTWIVPLQFLSSFILFYASKEINNLIDNAANSITEITLIFLSLVAISATQDIAVDGWAVSLISQKNKSYAATCQNIGLSLGYFSSFTLLMAFNSPDFCNEYLNFFGEEYGKEGVWPLANFLQFWAYFYFLFTIWLLFFVDEPKWKANSKKNRSNDEDQQNNNNNNNNNIQFSINNNNNYINNNHNNNNYNNNNIITNNKIKQNKFEKAKDVYCQMINLMKRKNIQDLMFILMLCKIGYTAEMVSSIELLGLGFKREHFAIISLIDFPLQFIYSFFGGKFSSGKSPLFAWYMGHVTRMVIAVIINFVIYFYPRETTLPLYYFALIFFCSLTSSAAYAIINVTQCGYFSRISDEKIGGTYMTLLTTISNLAGTFLTFPALYFIDYFTISTCISIDAKNTAIIHSDINCLDKLNAENCSLLYDGVCTVQQNGFYVVNISCLTIGLFLMFFIYRKLSLIHSSPSVKWLI